MIAPLFAETPWLLLLAQGTACLAAGLATSFALRHRPARAHQVLLTALLVSVLVPSLYVTAGHYGLGLLAPKPTESCSTPAVARASLVPKRELIAFGDPGPWISDPMGSPGPDGARPGWPRDGTPNAKDRVWEPNARAGRPRHDGRATDIHLLPALPMAETGEGPTPLTAEPVRAIPALSAATRRVPWSRIVVVCWGVATTILSLRLVLRFLLGWRVVHAAQPLAGERIHRALDTAQGRLGVEQSIQIRRSGSVHSPVIWCWSREPVLLVQEHASHAEDRADWTGVFCHEISHWRRRDHITGLVTEVLAAVFPWHPLLWWAKDRLLRLSEQACDDWVLATGQNDADYAEMLLGLAAERQMAFVPTTIGKGKTMNLRIRRIITESGSDPRVGIRWALAVGLLAVGTTVGVAVAQPRPAKPDLKDPGPTKVVKERREIDVREPPGTEQQQVAMKRVLERLMQQAGEKKETLRPGNDLSEEERQVQQIELKLLVEQIEQLKGRLEAPDRGPRKIGPKDPPEPKREARFKVLRQGHEELEQGTQKLERELKGLRDGQDQEAQELKAQLEQIRDKKVLVEKEMEELKRAQADDLKRGPKVKKEAAVAVPKREYRILKDELKIEKKAPNGPARISEDVKIEKKSPDGPARVIKGPAGNPQLEAEVQELRGQMKELHEQMQQMQKLLEQTVERSQKDRPAR